MIAHLAPALSLLNQNRLLLPPPFTLVLPALLLRLARLVELDGHTLHQLFARGRVFHTRRRTGAVQGRRVGGTERDTEQRHGRKQSRTSGCGRFLFRPKSGRLLIFLLRHGRPPVLAMASWSSRTCSRTRSSRLPGSASPAALQCRAIVVSRSSRSASSAPASSAA